ncbi:MAG: tRNA (adenosine(37)-N6)-threonylcarbamoyltransferase complex ATPase subunit type 1 TsaE [Xanthomonadales bacterium]|nr:tRNA (adenosine(37)-N6)-threonylcarbamoyltransferase complex ATPase subunit type 1 TsaE [Xanthomonadales bacterium]
MTDTERTGLVSPVLDEPALCACAQAMAAAVRPPLTCFLQGDLGAGKTTYVRAMLRALGHAGRVKSPTYGLLEHYELDRLDVLHLDLYRIENADELEFLGIDDLFGERTVLMVEWPERGDRLLPEPDFVIRFEHCGAGRRLRFEAHSARGRELLKSLQEMINSFSS